MTNTHRTFEEEMAAGAERSRVEFINRMDSLQGAIGKGNAERGFHEEGDRLRDASFPEDGALRNYYMSKLALVVTEAAEAIEELRAGRHATEVYFSGGEDTLAIADAPMSEHVPHDRFGNPRKPEGVPSEIADIVIRCFDFADEAGFSLGKEIARKLKYNATRGRMHGEKVI